MVAVGRPSRSGHEEPAGDRDAGRKRRQHGGKGDGLPQHDRGPRCTRWPGCPRQHCRDWSRQDQRDDGEGQRGHAVSAPSAGARITSAGGDSPVLGSPTRRVRGAARRLRRRRLVRRSAPGRASPAAGVRDLVERVDHQAGDPARRGRGWGAYRCARSSRCCTTRFFFASRCSTGHDRGVGQIPLGRQVPRGPGARFAGSREDHRWSITARSRSPSTRHFGHVPFISYEQ